MDFPILKASADDNRNPFPKRPILKSSKLKAVADDNFKLDENGRRFCNRVENTVGKGEIARYDRHDMTFAVKVALNPNTNKSINHSTGCDCLILKR